VLSPEEARALQAAHRDKLKNARAKVSREDARPGAAAAPHAASAQGAGAAAFARGGVSFTIDAAAPSPSPGACAEGGYARAGKPLPAGRAQLAEMIKVRRAFSPAPFAAAATLADR
jgi:hypothetical protein